MHCNAKSQAIGVLLRWNECWSGNECDYIFTASHISQPHEWEKLQAGQIITLFFVFPMNRKQIEVKMPTRIAASLELLEERAFMPSTRIEQSYSHVAMQEWGVVWGLTGGRKRDQWERGPSGKVRWGLVLSFHWEALSLDSRFQLSNGVTVKGFGDDGQAFCQCAGPSWCLSPVAGLQSSAGSLHLANPVYPFGDCVWKQARARFVPLLSWCTEAWYCNSICVLHPTIHTCPHFAFHLDFDRSIISQFSRFPSSVFHHFFFPPPTPMSGPSFLLFSRKHHVYNHHPSFH